MSTLESIEAKIDLLHTKYNAAEDNTDLLLEKAKRLPVTLLLAASVGAFIFYVGLKIGGVL